jgi:hypothetical protein
VLLNGVLGFSKKPRNCNAFYSPFSNLCYFLVRCKYCIDKDLLVFVLYNMHFFEKQKVDDIGNKSVRLEKALIFLGVREWLEIL